jgi:hypothetical protein
MTTNKLSRWLVISSCAVLGAVPSATVGSAEAAQPAPSARVQFAHRGDQGQLQVIIDGREAVVYQFGEAVDLPHFYPLRSPSGKLLTVQQTDPYPHHRSVWFADTVQLAGQKKVSFYNALYSRVDREDPRSPFRDHVRHVEFRDESATGQQAEISAKLVWETNWTTPLLDELRHMRIVSLGDGQYFVDLTFTLTASYGEVTFVSDAVHYAWPYVRVHPQFSGQQGGTIVNSEGGRGQAGTNNQVARWIDYFNTVDGVTEGLAIFSHSDNTHPHRWLTREYGTFGPRREDARSGKPFVLKKGESLKQRVGLLVHGGDTKAGQVAQRYDQYVQGKLQEGRRAKDEGVRTKH